MKTCPICGNSFEKNSNNQVNCSIKCTKKKYRDSHKDKLNTYSKEYNKSYIRDKDYYKKNKTKVLQYLKKYRQTKKGKLITKTASNKWSNSEKGKAYKRRYLKINMRYRLGKNLRLRIWHALKGNSKSNSTINLLGCTIEELKQHLQKQFKPDMNWDNYGKWHIDHIKPCAKFDLTIKENQEKCFHYTNLQPLWAVENLKKGGKY